MIQNHDGACLMQKLRALCIIRFICIHNYQKRISVHHLLSLGNRQKHMWIIIRVFPEAVDKGAGRRIRGVNDNIHLLIQRLRRAADPDGRTETVNIKILMPHDNNLFLAVHELLQRMCLDSGLDPGVPLHSLALSSEVSNAVPVLQDNLVAASAQRKINGNPCALIITAVRTVVCADSDTQCHGNIITDIDIFYFFQNIKLQSLHLVQGACPHHDNVFIRLIFFYNPVHILHVFADLPVNQGGKQRSPDNFDIFQSLIIIIQIDQTADHGFIFIFPDIAFQLRLVEEEKRVHVGGFFCLFFYDSGLRNQRVNLYAADLHPVIPAVR